MNAQMQIWMLHRAKTGQFLEYNLESLKDVNKYDRMVVHFHPSEPS